jgi:ABC-type uncharacterized transport system permease subunit
MAGMKGEGKTRKLIDMANQDAKITDGHLVYIDDDKRHIFDLHRDIRFVEAGKGELASYREFVGFVKGILSQNADIQHIYVDGLNNILQKAAVDDEALVKLSNRLKYLSDRDHVNFTIAVHFERDALPAEIKELLI